ncbi:Phosphoenolpyruvate-dihydroxyacetone phosphotransferase, subunit DhaM; DHA-specific IIA component [Actinomycetales bacterium JB111]|nr:Phosphoenolpyruvate-dihydroxyacetone phosphotransferase, subunit DhaM; DHA-specific IIA component [Actinomycetales bacterium JB111]
MPRTALVVVSHSADLARGLVALAAQMAADVRIVAAGGTDDGRIGTSFDAVDSAVESLLADDDVSGVVLVGDLGSAEMTIDSVLEMHDDAPVRHAHGPLVEGVVTAAVAAQGGADLHAVAAAVGEAARAQASAAEADGSEADAEPAAPAAPAEQAPAARDAPVAGDEVEDPDAVVRTIVIDDPMGLHARPAAAVAAKAATFTAPVTLNGVDGRSVLALMAANIPAGSTITVQASGEDADEAVSAVVQIIADAKG